MQDRKNLQVVCPSCGWTGFGRDCAVGEIDDYTGLGSDLYCPECSKKGAFVSVAMDDLVDDFMVRILADIRLAAGVNERPMLNDLPGEIAKIKKGHERYEKIRKMPLNLIEQIYKRNISTGRSFDDLVDEAVL